MTALTLRSERYRWTVHLYCAVHCSDAPSILENLQRMGCPEDIRLRARLLLESCALDTGLTYSDYAARESMVVVALTSSAAEFINSLSHEIRHLGDDFTIANGHFDKEEVGYFTGELNRAIFPEIYGEICKTAF